MHYAVSEPTFITSPFYVGCVSPPVKMSELFLRMLINSDRMAFSESGVDVVSMLGSG